MAEKAKTNKEITEDPNKGNVLVIGNSGVGKSTLINAVLGENKTETGAGTQGTTKGLGVYGNEEVSFRLIDTIGFEPNFMKRMKAINAVKEWSKKCAKQGRKDNQINMIWFCVEGTRKKLFEEDIGYFLSATSMWHSVPIVVVITKSYSVPERKENIALVEKAFEKSKRKPVKILPVVASIFSLNETAYAPPEGISELIQTTNELMPEGFKAARKDLSEFILNRKRVFAQSVVVTATAGGATVGAVPIPIPDAYILTPTEIAMTKVLAKIYDIKEDEDGKNFLNTIIEAGTVGAVGKEIIKLVKVIPGLQIAGAVLNAITAGVIVAAIGEVSIAAFEQVYLGNKTVKDLDWLKKILESKLSSETIEKIQKIIEGLSNSSTRESILKALMEIINVLNGNGKKAK